MIKKSVHCVNLCTEYLSMYETNLKIDIKTY